MANNSPLRRTLSLPLLTLYGTGTILGAGIYVLVGEVAAEAGMFAPIAFLVAAFIVAFTAFSYAELSSRIPKSGGEAAYVKAAFSNRFLASITGLAVVLSGLVSAATLTRGFVGYVEVFVQFPEQLVIIVVLMIMCALAIWGVSQSVMAAAIVTVLEVAGLLIVLALAGHHLGDLSHRWPELIPQIETSTVTSIFLGSYLAFYAFIGFEDIVNMAEETKNPSRSLPRAIIYSLVISTCLYVLVVLVALMAVPLERLAGSKAPLAMVLSERGPWAEGMISFISILAVSNGVLVQILMAARVFYGMAGSGLAPKALSFVHPRTQTPIIATLLVTGLILALALGFPLVFLARITTSVILAVFALVNVALFRIKLRDKDVVDGETRYPLWVPVIGALLCVGCLIANLYILSLGEL